MGRKCPAANVILYAVGAEGYAVDFGFDIYDIPAKQLFLDEDTFGRVQRQWAYTPSTRLSNSLESLYEPSIDAMRGINVVCPKPRMVRQNTSSAEYNFFGGLWQSRYSFEPPRVQYLFQKSSAKNTVWRAESKYLIPANAPLAITMQRLQAKYDNTETSYPAKVQVVISDSWQVRLSNGNDAGIWRRVGGQWRQEAHIALGGKSEEVIVWVIVRRGCVCFSFDQGSKWHIARDDEGALSIPQGQIVFEGVSCQAVFGFHQLAFDNCFYETYEIPTLEPHYIGPSVDLSQSHLPLGTTITLKMLESSMATAKWRLTMTVASSPLAGLSFNLYRVPELYATLVSWAPVLAPPIEGSVDLVSLGYVTEIDLEEEVEVNQRSGRLNLLWDVEDLFTGYFGYRLVSIKLGYMMDDDSFDIHDRAVMYIIQPEPKCDNNQNSDIGFELVDLYYRAVTTLVDEGWRPLDGMTPAEARNYIMYKMGLSPSRADWYVSGRVLPSGLPDYPRWWPKPGMTAADVFAAIDFYDRTETFVAADGTWTSRPYRYTDFGVYKTYDADSEDPETAIFNISNRTEHRDVKTAIQGSGQDLRGGSFWATSINYNQERNPNIAGFVGWRKWDRHDQLEVTSLAEAMVLLNEFRAKQQIVPYLPEIEIAGDPEIYRGFRIKMKNTGMVGQLDTTEYRVEGLSFRWRPTKKETRTSVRSRRVTWE